MTLSGLNPVFSRLQRLESEYKLVSTSGSQKGIDKSILNQNSGPFKNQPAPAKKQEQPLDITIATPQIRAYNVITS
jgi:hypothetical protein